MTDRNPAGYSADTQILARSGWMPFERLTCFDEVATRSPDGRFEWQHPSGFQCSRYRGEMIRFFSQHLDLLVTPSHQMLVTSRPRFGGVPSRRHGAEWIVSAADLAARCNPITQRIPRVSASHAPDLGAFCVPTSESAYNEYVTFDRETMRSARKSAGLRLHDLAPLVPASYTTVQRAEGGFTIRLRMAERISEILGISFAQHSALLPFTELPGDDFAAFMGMYLAEGCVTWHGGGGMPRRPTIYIAQIAKSKGFAEYRDLLARMLGREPAHNGRVFYFRHQGMAEYLRQFGHAHEKFMPADLLDLSARQAGIFWHFYWLGDGDTNRDRISTASERMADGLQQVAQQMGKWAAVIEKKRHGNVFPLPNGRTITRERMHPVWSVAAHKEQTSGWTAEASPYCGNIYSATVPNGVISTRRNGRPAWSMA
jgi:hypothetical protein